MKLSLERKMGWLQVRGGRVLRVALPHAVPTSTLNRQQTDHRRHPDRSDTVTCKPGDLAIEIVTAKTGKVHGHAYLSGAATQLHCYSAKAEWFAPGSAERRTLERPPVALDQAGFARYVAWAMDMKYGTADIYAFEFIANGETDAKGCADFFTTLYDYEETVNDRSQEQRSHVMALIHYGPRKHDGLVLLHFQPPHEAADIAASGFSVRLVLSSLPKESS